MKNQITVEPTHGFLVPPMGKDFTARLRRVDAKGSHSVAVYGATREFALAKLMAEVGPICYTCAALTDNPVFDLNGKSITTCDDCIKTINTALKYDISDTERMCDECGDTAPCNNLDGAKMTCSRCYEAQMIQEMHDEITWTDGTPVEVDESGIIQIDEPKVHPVFQPIFDAMFKRVSK